MQRRNFIYKATFAGLGLSTLNSTVFSDRKKEKNIRGTFSTNKNKISIFTKAEISPLRIFHITDTHLSLDDDRGNKYQKFSKRMAGAYKSNIHFQTNETISTKESFEQTLHLAKEQTVDFLALTGDIFSFPSEAAIDWALQKLYDTGIPFAYVAGNHDWHFEGMTGSSNQLRETWTAKLLKPLYQGKNPLNNVHDINGIRFVCIDNSTYEIIPQQLDFYKTQVKSGKPLVLLMHIPLYMPGRSLLFGCANPDWGENSDKGYQVERREKWRKGGHTKTTLSFYNEVFNTPNLLTILAGHTHRHTVDIKNGIPQLVSGHNATGYFTDIKINSLL